MKRHIWCTGHEYKSIQMSKAAWYLSVKSVCRSCITPDLSAHCSQLPITSASCHGTPPLASTGTYTKVYTLGNNSREEKQKDDTATQQRFLSWPSFWLHGSMSVALLTCYSLSNLPTSSLHSWCQGVFRDEGWRCAQGTRRSALPEGHSPSLLLLHPLWHPRKDSA